MTASDEKILNNYIAFLEGLNTQMKLKIMEHLKESLKAKPVAKSKILSSFGQWNSEESAEDVIKDLRQSRNTNRFIEEL